MTDPRDTICALSSAPGRAGIAVVRVSGGESFALLRRFSPGNRQSAPRQAVLVQICDPRDGEEIDRALVTCFPAPHSYTGEDVVEISMHGSPILVSTLLEALCACGARLAEPGEFTMRAFLRGRMDLAQAEAVRDVIEATTLYQAQVAARQQSGELSRTLEPLKRELIDVIVQLESAVEFVEEDLSLASRDQLAGMLEEVQGRLTDWAQTFRRGRVVREGFSMAIVGRANVGKSSLFNALLAQERSIVTEMPGTTRDLVSEVTNIGGVPVRLLDTAGVRDSSDRVEQMGVDRSFRAMADADAVLLVVDCSEARTREDEELRARLRELSCITVANKVDLPRAWTAEEAKEFAGRWRVVDVSAKTGLGVDALREGILQQLFGAPGLQRDGVLITNLRHARCVESAGMHVARAAVALRGGVSEEFALFDLHSGLRSLGEITGEVSAEDLLSEIFSRFCIGK